MSTDNFDFDIDSILSEYTAGTNPAKGSSEKKGTGPHPTPDLTETPVLRRREAQTEEETVIRRTVPTPEEIPDVRMPSKQDRKETTATRQASRKTEERVEAEDEDDEDDGGNVNVLNVVLGILLGIVLIWGVINIRPYRASKTTGSVIAPLVTASPAPTEAPVTEGTATETATDPGTEEQPAETVENRPVYKLEEGQPAPKPNSACFGQCSTADAAKIDEVIAQARQYGLLGPEEAVYFRSDLPFNTGSYYQDIMYYLDESILAVCWKEIEDGFTLTMCEIKIGDGSQFRMEVYGDVYNENDNSYLSQMIMANNGVVAMNSDKCKARGDGVLVCDRVLYKYNENPYAGSLKRYNCLDNCYVTGDGDFLFTKRLEEKTTEQMQQYIIDNNIIFSMSFGPLLIENGQMVYGYNPGDENYIEYAFGETEKPYSRCGIGQIGQRHYLYTSLNHSDEQAARWTMREFAQHIYDRGIMQNFYALDGGQTAELIIGSTIYNHIDFGAERYTSNCIYFATAVPNGEG